MTVDLAALAKLASEATPGPWHVWDRGIGWEVHTEEVAPDGHPWCPSLMDFDSLGKGVFRESMAAYIAAVSPDVVLALVRVALAAKEYAAFTHGNIRGPKYHARQEARDALSDALEELE